MKRYCSYCKKQTEHECRKDIGKADFPEYDYDEGYYEKADLDKSGDFKCTVCGSTSINIQGIHMDLM